MYVDKPEAGGDFVVVFRLCWAPYHVPNSCLPIDFWFRNPLKQTRDLETIQDCSNIPLNHTPDSNKQLFMVWKILAYLYFGLVCWKLETKFCRNERSTIFSRVSGISEPSTVFGGDPV